MDARNVARIAVPLQSPGYSRTQGERDRGGIDGQPEAVPTEFHLRGNVNVPLAARGNEVVAFWAQQSRGFEEGEAREGVEQRQLSACLRRHGLA